MSVLQIDLWPALVGGAVSFMLGGLWYGPLFGSAWLEARGLPPDHRIPPAAYALGFVCFLALAATLSILSSWAGVSTAGEGLRLAAVVWVGVVFALGLNATLFTGASLVAFSIDAGYQLVVVLGLGALLSVWS